jgi:MoxR-like ATPase
MPQRDRDAGMNLLLTGKPGSGKTALAERIAQKFAGRAGFLPGKYGNAECGRGFKS